MRDLNKIEINSVNGGWIGLVIKAGRAIGKALTSKTATRATVTVEVLKLEGSTPQSSGNGG